MSTRELIKEIATSDSAGIPKEELIKHNANSDMAGMLAKYCTKKIPTNAETEDNHFIFKHYYFENVTLELVSTQQIFLPEMTLS